jgi:subtilisin family serine protease
MQMKSNVTIITALVLIIRAAAGAAMLEQKSTERLRNGCLGIRPEQEIICWVEFRDKAGIQNWSRLHPKAEARRARTGRALSYGDLPVSSGYMASIAGCGGRIRTVSPWLNSVSGYFTEQQLEQIAALPFVERLDLVSVFLAPPLELSEACNQGQSPSVIDYGYADAQIKLMRINELHDLGYTGAGVKLAFLDTGFDRWHQALAGVNIIGERDFQRMVITGIDTVSLSPLALDTLWGPDSITSFEEEQDSLRVQTQHGTAMLSIAGAYLPGTLVGSAYNSEFILAKTEWLFGSDFYLEEDWWIAGLQWAADSMGADIVSSSLAYRQWSDHPSYTYLQMNGEYARCSAAAESAAARGVLIINALGNIGSYTTRPDTCIVAPADADGIISVGGVWPSTGQWAYSSATGRGPSAGPAADSIKIKRFGGSDSIFMRRIKPEIASAWQNAFADNMDTVDYSRILSGTGTSGATALTAGLCALLLEAHPDWGPAEVINALKYSGNNRATVELYLAHPESIGLDQSQFAGIASGNRYYILSGDTFDLYNTYRIGWGIPDGIEALNYTGVEYHLDNHASGRGARIISTAPNPSQDDIWISYELRQCTDFSIVIYNIQGQMIRRLSPEKKQTGRNVVKWNSRNDSGTKVGAGVYLFRLETGLGSATRKIIVLR